MWKDKNMITIAEKLESVAGVASVQFCGRSGSFLLSNLLDSHPNVLSCPPHSLLNGLDKMYALMGDLRRTGQPKFNLNDFVAKICTLFPMLFKLDNENASQQEKFLGKSCHKMEYGADKEKFRKELQKYLGYYR